MITILIREVLDTVEPKWRVEVISALAGEPLRYTELQRALSNASDETVHSSTINKVLGILQDKGVIEHAAPGDKRSPYQLTADGQALKDLLDYVGDWGQRHGHMFGL